MSTTRTKADTLARIEDYRARWRQLVADVGEERMELPGPMGVWTFKDLAAHLTFYRNWTISRLEAGRGRDAPLPWPEGLIAYDPDDPDAADWDRVNAWVHEQHRDRPLPDVLAESEASFDRLTAAVTALSEADVTTPGRFAWLGNHALADADFGGHLRDEHEADVRAWLAQQPG